MKRISKLKSEARKFEAAAKLVGRAGKEIAKRTLSQKYTNKQVFGPKFGKKK